MADNQQFDNMLYRKLGKVIEEKKGLKNPLIEILHSAQKIFGFIPEEVLNYISERLDIPLSKLYGVITFYRKFSCQPHGKYLINICTGTSCYFGGSQQLIGKLEKELGIKLGETTANGLFTLSSLRCLGVCSQSPALVINNDTYGCVDSTEKIREIISRYKL